MRALLFTALLTGCCWPGYVETPIHVSLEGPVRAELAYDRDGYGGFFSVLRVTAPIASSIQAHCIDNRPPDLVGDGTRYRLAYRCHAGEPWALIYVGPSALVEHCASPLGSGPTPDFAAAPPDVAEAAGELGACAEPEEARSPWRPETFPLTFEQAREMGPGPLLTALGRARMHVNATGWEEFARGLDPASLEALRVRLRSELATEPFSTPGVCRALEVLGDDDAVVLSRAQELVGRGGQPPPCPSHAEGILAALYRDHPDAALALACANLEAVESGSPVGHVLPALHLVAETGAACDVRDWLGWMRCYPGLRCGDRLCTDPDAITPGPEAVTDPEIVQGYREILRIALRSGPLPPEWIALDGCD